MARPKASKVILFHKPFNTLCQFTGEPGDSTLSDFIPIKGVYAAGRLDKDSEGLLVLTNDGKLQHKISHPKYKKPKEYWVQVEGELTQNTAEQLSKGVKLKDGITKPAKVRLLTSQEIQQIGPRTPPIRYRKNDCTSWLSLTIYEGKNRQVRRMTAAVGLPTLRLIRVKVGNWSLDELQPGEYK